MDVADAQSFVPLIQENLVHSEPNVRYFARKARNSLGKGGEKTQPGDDDLQKELSQSSLSTREILMRKIRLGSRYVAFEAMDRLTESRDSELAGPLISFIEAEKDSFKVSYLIKRIWKIPDPRIPETIKSQLQHSDLRVVANALEGLWELDVPQYREIFAKLAEHPDNRIRANAVRALFKYLPDEAEKFLKVMLETPNIPNQDSAVFLLKVLRPKNVGKLAEIALNSQFAGVRLRALEIPIVPGLSKENSVGGDSERTEGKDGEQGGAPFRKRDVFGLIASIFISGIYHFFLHPQSIAISLLIVLISLMLLGISARKNDSFLAKVALSMVFLAVADDGIRSLSLAPALLLVWIGLADPSWVFANRGRIFACIFAFSALLLSSLSVNKYLKLADGIACLADFMGKPKPILDVLMAQKRNFFGILFFLISLGTILIAQIDSILPRTTEKSRSLRFYLIVMLGGAMAVLATQLSYGFGVTTLLATNGLTDPAQIIRFLSE